MTETYMTEGVSRVCHAYRDLLIAVGYGEFTARRRAVSLFCFIQAARWEAHRV